MASLMQSEFSPQRHGQRLYHLWQIAIEPPTAIHDPDIRWRLRMINGLVLLIIVVALLALVVQLIIDPIDEFVQSTTLSAIVLGVAVALLIYVLGRVTHSFRLVGWVAMTVGFVAVLAVATSSQPPHFEFNFLIFLPLFGTMFFSFRETLLVSVLALASLLVVAGIMPTMPHDTLKDLVIFNVLTQLFILFVIQQRNQLESSRQTLVLEKARNELLSRLIANLTHDFRTPLAVINTTAYLLERSPDAHTRQEKLEQISQQTHHINRILDDILTLSKLDYTFEISPKRLDINRILLDSAYRFSSKIESKNLHLAFDLAQDLCPILANQEYLGRAIANIVENAVQFTPEGGSVTIRSQSNSQALLVEISDTGIGIDNADLEHVFEPFFRGDSARSAETGGAGLGLSIARRVVEMHGGTINITSTRSSGSTVQIKLPLNRGAQTTSFTP